MPDITLHRLTLSGHSHRVEAFLHLLDLPYRTVDVDVLKGAHKQPNFLALNPFGQVPVLQDGDVTLSDSNAILVYLAARYGGPRWQPGDPVHAARIQRWLSVAAGELAHGASAARVAVLFKRDVDTTPLIARANALLALMERHLADSPFLVGAEASIADLALYGYTARAPEGNVSLVPYAAVRAWLERVEALPRFLPFAKSPVGLPA
ncbi:glutathione S-transferase family protein [Rhizobacter sp. LjRoot28]|uniref:glutathione S-transferase family protein n=1 Tax=Rhizobacter sp. LjRoot28 TaxID=3342309 RepID=UPI003ECF6DED